MSKDRYTPCQEPTFYLLIDNAKDIDCDWCASHILEDVTSVVLSINTCLFRNPIFSSDYKYAERTGNQNP